MKFYRIKGNEVEETYLGISGEDRDEYLLTIIKRKGDQERRYEERMAKHLLDMCVRTGFFLDVDGIPA